MIVWAIHGYWNADIGDAFQDMYMAKIANIIRNNNIETIICSWGFTNPKKELSEAWSIQYHLESLEIRAHFLLEQESFATYDNIKNISSFLSNIHFSQVYVFASNIHLAKTIFSSLQIYPVEDWKPCSAHQTASLMQDMTKNGSLDLKHLDKDSEIIIGQYHFIGLELGRTYNDTIKQVYASVIETQYHDFEDLNADFVNYRKKIRGITS